MSGPEQIHGYCIVNRNGKLCGYTFSNRRASCVRNFEAMRGLKWTELRDRLGFRCKPVVMTVREGRR